MSSTLTTKDFIKKFINKCFIVKPSRLDKTIKAIINTYTNDNLDDIIGYLNKIRVIYYLKRLDFKDSRKARTYKSKSLLEYIKRANANYSNRFNLRK